MSTRTQNEAKKIRARLNHPIIDADGHWAEFPPLMRQEFRRIGGDTAVEALDMASRAHSELAQHVGRGAAAPSDRPGGILVPADEEHAGSRDGDDAAPPVRAARRSRPRFLRHLADQRARLLPSAAGQTSPRAVPRVQHVRRGAVPSVR